MRRSKEEIAAQARSYLEENRDRIAAKKKAKMRSFDEKVAAYCEANRECKMPWHEIAEETKEITIKNTTYSGIAEEANQPLSQLEKQNITRNTRYVEFDNEKLIAVNTDLGSFAIGVVIKDGGVWLKCSDINKFVGCTNNIFYRMRHYDIDDDTISNCDVIRAQILGKTFKYGPLFVRANAFINVSEQILMHPPKWLFSHVHSSVPLDVLNEDKSRLAELIYELKAMNLKEQKLIKEDMKTSDNLKDTSVLNAKRKKQCFELVKNGMISPEIVTFINKTTELNVELGDVWQAMAEHALLMINNSNGVITVENIFKDEQSKAVDPNGILTDETRSLLSNENIVSCSNESVVNDLFAWLNDEVVA